MRLGKFEIQTLRAMLEGGYARQLIEFDLLNRRTSWIVDASGNDIDDVDNRTIDRLIRKKLITKRTVYSTISPNTETSEFTLEPDAIEGLKQRLL